MNNDIWHDPVKAGCYRISGYWIWKTGYWVQKKILWTKYRHTLIKGENFQKISAKLIYKNCVLVDNSPLFPYFTKPYIILRFENWCILLRSRQNETGLLNITDDEMLYLMQFLPLSDMLKLRLLSKRYGTIHTLKIFWLL